MCAEMKRCQLRPIFLPVSVDLREPLVHSCAHNLKIF